MSLPDGTYLIHSSAENMRNFYTLAGYEGQAVGTVSGGSFENPTEVSNILLLFLYLYLLTGHISGKFKSTLVAIPTQSRLKDPKENGLVPGPEPEMKSSYSRRIRLAGHTTGGWSM